MTLQFNAERHEYKFSGAIVPSVTQIMKPLYEYAGIPAGVLEVARVRGDYIHKAAELLIWDLLDEDELEDEYRPYIEGFKLFLHETKFEADMTEHKVYHKALRYAGTFDLAGVFPGFRKNRPKRALVDTKATFRMMESVGPQTAAYADAYASDKPKELHFQERYGLRLTADGKYELKPMKDIGDMTVFRSCLNIHNYFNRRKKA